MSAPIYVLDANVFIEAANGYYAFDIAKGFWKGLVDHGNLGNVISIDRVGDEVEKGNDDLAKWMQKEFREFCKSTDDAKVSANFAQIMKWVQGNNQFTNNAKAEFAGSADGWLIAHAMLNNSVVVTREVYAPDIKWKVKIPNVCKQFNVPHIDTYELMRRLGLQLSLSDGS